MFTPTYFAPTYFASTFFASAASISGGSSTGGYFASTFFASTYFAPTYFPREGEAGEVEYPDDLVDAVAAFAAADASLVAEGVAIWTDQRPAGVEQPVIIIRSPKSAKVAEDDTYTTHRVTLEVIAQASTKPEASRLGMLVESVFNDQRFVYGTGGRFWTDATWNAGVTRSKEQGETIGGRKVHRLINAFACHEFRPRR